jgi:hypothetical protein
VINYYSLFDENWGEVMKKEKVMFEKEMEEY